MASLKKRVSMYVIQWYEGGKQRRRSLNTGSLQVAREKVRWLESARFRGEDCPLPPRTERKEKTPQVGFEGGQAGHCLRRTPFGITTYRDEPRGPLDYTGRSILVH